MKSVLFVLTSRQTSKKTFSNGVYSSFVIVSNIDRFNGQFLRFFASQNTKLNNDLLVEHRSLLADELPINSLHNGAGFYTKQFLKPNLTLKLQYQVRVSNSFYPFGKVRFLQSR